MNKTIKLYGQIGSDEINGSKITSLFADLENAGCKHLTIHFHSYGGSVIEGNIIYNAIHNSNMYIKIIIDGIAASMAGIILFAADEVEISENGYIMIHRPIAPGQGDADAHLQTAKLLKDMEEKFAVCIAQKSGIPIEEIQANWLNGKDNWLNADEAVKYGFATRKIRPITDNIKTLDKQAVTAMGAENIYKSFAANLNTKNKTKMKKLLIEKFNLQGVTENSTDEEIIAKLVEMINELKKNSDTNEETIEALLNNCSIKDTRLFDTYKAIGVANGIKALLTILPQHTNYPDITALIKSEPKTHPSGSFETPSDNKHDVTKWTLNDYRKYAPQMLKDNPKLYDELYKQEYGK